MWSCSPNNAFVCLKVYLIYMAYANTQHARWFSESEFDFSHTRKALFLTSKWVWIYATTSSKVRYVFLSRKKSGVIIYIRQTNYSAASSDSSSAPNTITLPSISIDSSWDFILSSVTNHVSASQRFLASSKPLCCATQKDNHSPWTM